MRWRSRFLWLDTDRWSTGSAAQPWSIRTRPRTLSRRSSSCWRCAESIRSQASIASWLFGVASRVSAHAKSDATRRRKHEHGAAKLRPTSALEIVHERPDPSPALHEELARLPGHYRDALVLCYLEGQTCDEAARRLGRPVGTVKARLSRRAGS